MPALLQSTITSSSRSGTSLHPKSSQSLVQDQVHGNNNNHNAFDLHYGYGTQATRSSQADSALFTSVSNGDLDLGAEGTHNPLIVITNLSSRPPTAWLSSTIFLSKLALLPTTTRMKTVPTLIFLPEKKISAAFRPRGRKSEQVYTEQLAQSRSLFRDEPQPYGFIRRELSRRLRMPERSVQVWFQNRRVKSRLLSVVAILAPTQAVARKAAVFDSPKRTPTAR